MSKVIEVYSKGERYEVLVDDDFEFDRKICLSGKTGSAYACFTIEGKHIYLHRWIVNAKKGEVVDHRNGNKLDNRRDNLRICTKKQNSQNRRDKGYYWHKRAKKWLARIKINGASKYLGLHSSPEEAQQAYRKAHIEAFGEFSSYYKYDSGITKGVN